MINSLKNLFALKPEYEKRVFGLDAFRAVAILFVVMGHGGFIIDKVLPGFPYVRLIDGVELFFVLSGFLIGTILIKIYEKQDGMGFRDTYSFWKRRWYRTLPNYYLILFVNILFVYFGIIHGDFEQFSWKFFLFLQNFNTYFTDFFWESWSLTIEEWFYIFTPLGIVLFHLLMGKFIPKKWIVISVAGFFILFPLLYRISISGEQVDHFWYDVKFRKVVLTRLDAIMFGVVVAWIKFYYPIQLKKTAFPLFVLGAVLMYTVMHLAKLDPVGFLAKTFYFSSIGIGAALMIPLADNVKSLNNSFGRAVTHISLISYSMYLINLSVVAQVIQANFWPLEGMDALLMYILYWTIVVVISTLLYKFFEKPVMDLRDKSTVKTEIS